MKTITRIAPGSLAKILGLAYALFGVLIGLIMAVIALVAGTEESGIMGILLGVAAPIFLALIYGLMGWVGGYVTGWIYNLVAKRVGGIKIEVE